MAALRLKKANNLFVYPENFKSENNFLHFRLQVLLQRSDKDMLQSCLKY
jgi:hypothetical protein